MSLPWQKRKLRLAALILSRGDDNADGAAVDRLMHGQNAIGKTSKTIETDALRFQDKDLLVNGTLEYGQFGVIELVTCRLDNRLYVRKSVEKAFAMRTREQCSPQTERDILLAATLSDSPWAPHLLAAYQMSTHLHLVMDYAEGGNLWDVLESSTGKLSESDLKWWAPQVASAVHWCHSQGYVHRDIKPHNFVITKDSRVQLIDFGSAAPLIAGTTKLARKHCLVPCGTCDYISPEILQAHEEALVALEMEDDQDLEGYGLEADWWSLGAMLYELAYGVAPFFANEIRHTYQRILNHKKSLRFPTGVSAELEDLLKRLLTDPDSRVGRAAMSDHPFFAATDWATLSNAPPPPNLHLPQFTYAEPQPAKPAEFASPAMMDEKTAEYSQGFAFSGFFHSSFTQSHNEISLSQNITAMLRSSVSRSHRDDPSSAFIGFTWGPRIDAFPDQPDGQPSLPPSLAFPTPHFTPSPFRPLSHATTATPVPTTRYSSTLTTPNRFSAHQFVTPMRPYSGSHPTHTHMNTIRRASTATVPRTVGKRDVTDREAMKQLVDCIGMSARKKVLESGRKPRILTPANFGSANAQGRRTSSSLRFDMPPSMGSLTDASAFTRGGGEDTLDRGDDRTDSNVRAARNGFDSGDEDDYENPSITSAQPRLAPLVITGNETSLMDTTQYSGHSNTNILSNGPSTVTGTGYMQYYLSSDCSDSEGPPSPSPRPTSAMSTTTRSLPSQTSRSARSIRSVTPTATATMSMSFSNRMRSGSASSSYPNISGSGFLSVPDSSTRGANLLADQSLRGGQGDGESRVDDRRRAYASLGRGGAAAAAVAVPTPVPISVGPAPVFSLPVQREGEEPQGELDSGRGQPQQVRRRSSNSWDGDDVGVGLWDGMEGRHERMMRDIQKLEQRLELVSLAVSVTRGLGGSGSAR